MVRLQVVNTGGVAGIETVQVYATCEACVRSRLPILLVGFARTSNLEPSASQEVEVTFSRKDLAIFDMEKDRWFLEKGTYQILAGPCADPAVLKSVDLGVPEDVLFDYPGASSPPDIASVGDRSCAAYTCRRDEEFLRLQEDFDFVARRNSLTVLALLLGLVVASTCGFCCCCVRPFCRCLCGKRAVAATKVEKDKEE